MKCFVWLFVFVLAVGFVCAADGWGDINSEVGGRKSVVEGDGGNDSVDDSVVADGDYVAPDYSSEGSGWIYTDNFYIALGLGGFGLLIVIYFIYMFFKRPKNKWKS